MTDLPFADQKVINETKEWIENIVIKHEFCPFAARPYFSQNIDYQIINDSDLREFSNHFLKELQALHQSTKPETTLLIFPDSVKDFYTYLDLLGEAQDLLVENDFEGILQLASFHPLYQFAGTAIEDVTNKTNRSPYPIIQILREDSITRVLKNYPNPEQIPEKNMAKARQVFGKKTK